MATSGVRESEGHDRRVAAILDITEVLCGKTEYTEVVAAALEASLETVDAEAGSILLHSPAEEALVFDYVVGPIAAQLLGRSFSCNQGIAGQVFRTGVPLLTNDVSREAAHLRRIAEETGYPSRTMITVPLKTHGGRTLGVLQAINRRHGVFQPEDLELLAIIASQAATIIENARLHEAARLGAVARLMGSLGHDVKNMIAPVATCAAALETILEKHFAYLERAVAEGDGNGDARAMAQHAHETHSRCREAITCLERAAERVRERTLQMADCLRGNITPSRMLPTDIPKVVGEVVSVLQPTASEQGVRLQLEQEGACPPALADGSRLFNAVYNLAINAISETPPGGRVTVRVEGPLDGSPAGGCTVKIEVRDTGRGMSPEMVRKLFTGEIVSTKVGGTGIGTRIVKDVADIHGGTVTATSELGEGSCFTLTLPLVRAEAAPPGGSA